MHQKKFRDQKRVFVAEGLKLVNDALQSTSASVQMLIYTASSQPHLQDKIDTRQDQCHLVSAKEYSQISMQKSPQEVMAVLSMGESTAPKELKDDLLLILDKIRDPGNMGTIIRLADWFGIKNIVCSEDTVDCYNPKVVQSSMGAIFRVGISYTSLPEYLKSLREGTAIKIYGTSLKGGDLYETSLQTPGVIILGNEAEGISKEVAQLADTNLMIPNYSNSTEKSESLNAAVAAAIICSEFRRQGR